MLTARLELLSSDADITLEPSEALVTVTDDDGKSYIERDTCTYIILLLCSGADWACAKGVPNL